MYYEYLLNELVTSNQVKLNLRRTIDKGLISSLNRLQEVKLALKYFGVDKNGNYTSDTDNIVNYRCPYSGEIGYDDLALDHIIPVKSKGGTVLFNCIPVKNTHNNSKHSNNLLTWWSNKPYFDYERLNRLIQYMLEAYEIYDKEIIEEDDYIYEEENILEEQEDLTKSITKEDIEEDKIDTSIDESVTYYQFITNLIEKLSNDRNVDVYKERLLKLKEDNKFGELTELDEIIKIVQKIIEEKIGNDNEIYLSYSLNINIRKLYNSLKTKEYEKEIRERFSKIEEILKQENKPFTSYFKNLIDIEEENILYFDSLDDKKINSFINSLKIDFDTKLELFIEMMADEHFTNYKNRQPDGSNIFKSTNKVPFLGTKEEYGLNTAQFWAKYQDEIIKIIEEKLEELSNKNDLTEEEQKELEKYEKAKQAYKIYEVINYQNLPARIDLFIEMMATDDYTKYENGEPTTSNIFVERNEIQFIGIKKEYGLNTAGFWNTNQDKIIQRIEEKLEELSNKNDLTEEDQKELEKYEKAKQAYKTYEIINNLNKSARIDLFIEMMADEKYTNYEGGNPDEHNIFCAQNKETFVGLDKKSGLNAAGFWNRHDNQERIKQRIEEKLEELSRKNELTAKDQKELEKYQKAKEAYKTYEIMNSKDSIARIELFIEMMADEHYTNYKDGKPIIKENIFSASNEFQFIGVKKEYSLYVGQFWAQHQDEIIPKIEEKLEELSNKKKLTEEEQKELVKYEKAKEAYKTYEVMNQNNPTARIDLFIEMMADEKYTNYEGGKPIIKENIFSASNEFQFIGVKKEYGLNIDDFWHSNYDKIIKIIEENLEALLNKPELKEEDKKELVKYQKAKQAYKTYEIINRVLPKIDLFIEMMTMPDYTKLVNGKPDKDNIFKTTNKVPFKGVKKEYGLNTAYFWGSHSVKEIIPLLFFSDKYESSKYDIARDNTMKYLNYVRRRNQQSEFNNIYEYILTLDAKKKEVKELIKLRDERLEKKKQLIEENEELKNNSMNKKAI